MSTRFGWCVPSFGVQKAFHQDCARVFLSKGIEHRCGCTDEGCPCAEWNAANPQNDDESSIVQSEDENV